VISVFARAARLEINPFFVSPLAKGEIRWGSGLPAFAGIEAEPAVYFIHLSAEETSLADVEKRLGLLRDPQHERKINKILTLLRSF
jgi:hypothetical protein